MTDMFQLNPNVEVPEGILIADGLDAAAVGYTTLPDGTEHVIYDYDKCCSVLMTNSGNEWTYEEAVEWMEFNVVSAYVGPQTPIWMYR